MGEDWRAHAYYQALSAAQLSGSQDHDRAVLTLASGTLALSATFLHDVAPTPVAGSIGLLSWSWFALTAAIVCIVMSYQTSQWAMQATMQGRSAPATFRTRLTIGLTLAGDAGFIAGVVLFAKFALSNL